MKKRMKTKRIKANLDEIKSRKNNLKDNLFEINQIMKR